MTKSIESNQLTESTGSLTSIDLSSTSKLTSNSQNLIVKAPKDKRICDEPAYLFWKIQSRLAKLTNRLRLEKRIIIDNKEVETAKMQRDTD